MSQRERESRTEGRGGWIEKVAPDMRVHKKQKIMKGEKSQRGKEEKHLTLS